AASFFFFSSRRRHTRSKRDWSSDVCSSDLGGLQHLDVRRHFEAAPTTSRRRAPCERAPLALPQGERQGCGDRSRRGEKVAAVHGSSSCPSWDRTRTLLIQSQACCQLHQGAVFYMELRGLEPLTSWVRSRRSPS